MTDREDIMETETRTIDQQTPTAILPAHDDMIRVVETYVPDELRAPAVAPPQLVYNGGPLLSAVEVFTIFWGTAWEQSPQNGLINQVNSFFDFILTSPLIDQLKEYSVPQFSIGHGKRIGTTTITKPKVGKTVSDKSIQHMLQQEIVSNSAFPPPGPNVLYFVYLPPGVSVTQGGGRSCQVFCGYHNDIGGKIFYAVMPYPGCTGCRGPLQEFDALTSTSSHELCEAITDAIPGQGWYDQANGEIGDICAWKTKKVGQYTVQLEWSNQQNKCI
jgi:hypothetical protein